MQYVVLRPGDRGLRIGVTSGGPADAQGIGIRGALLRTVSNGADAVVDVLAGVGTPALVEALSGPEVAGLRGGRLVVQLGRGVADRATLAAIDALFARFDDGRIFVAVETEAAAHSDAGIATIVSSLAARGFRTFLLGSRVSTWREVRAGEPLPATADGDRVDAVYGAPAVRCRTVSTLVHRGGLSGAERSHVEMVESLVRQGGMAHTVVPLPDDGLREALTALGSSVDVIGALQWWMEPLAGSPRGVVGAPQRRILDPAVLRSLEAVGADVVMTQTSVVPQGALAAAALDRPHVWFVREFGDIDQGLSHPWPRAEFAAVVEALSDVVVVNSAPVRDHLFGPDATAVRVLPPLSDVEAAIPSGRAGGRPWTVSVVAAVIPGKGQQDAIEALALLRDDVAPVRLALVGPGGGAERQSLEALARRLGVLDLVEFRGEVRDRAAAYGDTDAVAVTSRAEAYGRVPFEATAFGLPVIYANAGGPAEYMVAGVTGLAYAPGDASALAGKIRQLRDDPALGARLVAQAREEFGSPQRREAFDAGVRELFLPLTGRASRPVPGHLLGVVVADACSQLSDASARFAEQLESATRAHADLAEARAARGLLEAEAADLKATNADLQDRLSLLVNSRTWRLRGRLTALRRPRPR